MPFAEKGKIVSHKFRAGSQLDFRNVRDLQDAVQRNFVNGQPRHWQESATKEDFDPNDENASAIFVTDYKDHMARSDSAIGNILKHRNILVRNTPHELDGQFDIQTLRSLVGHSSKYFSIQGCEFIRHCLG